MKSGLELLAEDEVEESQQGPSARRRILNPSATKTPDVRPVLSQSPDTEPSSDAPQKYTKYLTVSDEQLAWEMGGHKRLLYMADAEKWVLENFKPDAITRYDKARFYDLYTDISELMHEADSFKISLRHLMVAYVSTGVACLSRGAHLETQQAYRNVSVWLDREAGVGSEQQIATFKKAFSVEKELGPDEASLLRTATFPLRQIFGINEDLKEQIIYLRGAPCVHPVPVEPKEAPHAKITEADEERKHDTDEEEGMASSAGQDTQEKEPIEQILEMSAPPDSPVPDRLMGTMGEPAIDSALRAASYIGFIPSRKDPKAAIRHLWRLVTMLGGMAVEDFPDVDAEEVLDRIGNNVYPSLVKSSSAIHAQTLDEAFEVYFHNISLLFGKTEEVSPGPEKEPLTHAPSTTKRRRNYSHNWSVTDGGMWATIAEEKAKHWTDQLKAMDLSKDQWDGREITAEEWDRGGDTPFIHKLLQPNRNSEAVKFARIDHALQADAEAAGQKRKNKKRKDAPQKEPGPKKNKPPGPPLLMPIGYTEEQALEMFAYMPTTDTHFTNFARRFVRDQSKTLVPYNLLRQMSTRGKGTPAPMVLNGFFMTIALLQVLWYSLRRKEYSMYTRTCMVNDFANIAAVLFAEGAPDGVKELRWETHAADIEELRPLYDFEGAALLRGKKWKTGPVQNDNPLPAEGEIAILCRDLVFLVARRMSSMWKAIQTEEPHEALAGAPFDDMAREWKKIAMNIAKFTTRDGLAELPSGKHDWKGAFWVSLHEMAAKLQRYNERKSAAPRKGVHFAAGTK